MDEFDFSNFGYDEEMSDGVSEAILDDDSNLEEMVDLLDYPESSFESENLHILATVLCRPNIKEYYFHNYLM